MPSPNPIDFDSPPLTPSASDLSDVGSLSDSDWYEVTSSSHGSASDSDDGDRDGLPPASELDPALPELGGGGGGLQLSLGGEWQGVLGERAAADQQPVSIEGQPAALVDDAPPAATPLSDEQTAPPSEERTDPTENEIVSSTATDSVAYDPDAFKLEFPDPLSSSDDMLDPNSSMNSTWTEYPADTASDNAEAAQDSDGDNGNEPIDLAIVVLGHRPSLARTQRVVNILVEAVADALDADHLVHHTDKHAALFGTHDIVQAAGQQTFRVLATEDADKARAAARCLALVFFSSTRIMRAFPLRDQMPHGTRYLPLLHSSASFTPPSMRREESGSYSFPSSVESSILVSPSNHDTTQTSRTDNEWALFSVPHEDVLDIWPQGVSRQAVMPVNLLERRAAMLGMREGFFTHRTVEGKSEDAPAALVSQFNKDSSKARLAGQFREHTWTTIAVISMLLAVITSQVFVPRYNHPSVSLNASTVPPTPSPTTTLAPPPVRLAPTQPAPVPPAQAQTQAHDSSRLPSSLRNLALSVFSNDKDKAIAEVPPEAGPSRGTTASLAGETRTKSPAAASQGTAAAPPLTLDAPARTPLLTGAAQPAETTDLAARLPSWRELLADADDILAAARPRVQQLAKAAAARHQRARHNARRIHKRIGPQRAREGLGRVMEAVASRSEQFREARANFKWEFHRTYKWGDSANQEPAQEGGKSCSSKLFCGMRGRNA
ncbi:hypothetical protein AURDEDRAFT_183058 [Auricularia subglabra TFB-10046 SS5]|nr:hypothetical protein AURDEDRAFT_183058 [Auricularia subglabra TFB-10046 SS5]